MDSSASTIFLLFLLFSCLAYHLLSLLVSKQLPYPPGPRRWPILGNILHFPRGSRPWFSLLKASQEYGDLVFYDAPFLPGTSILVVNSFQAMKELLGERSGTYSDRPKLVVVGELMGLSQATPFLPSSPTWNLHRRLLHTYMNPKEIRKYDTILSTTVNAFLHQMMNTDSSHHFFHHITMACGKITMATVYGLDVHGQDIQENIEHAEKTTSMITQAAVPGAFLVDMVPLLKYLPTWVPLTQGFRSYGEKGRSMVQELITKPFELVKSQILRSEEDSSLPLPPSFTRDALLAFDEKKKDVGVGVGGQRAEYDEVVRWVSGSLYGAGSEAIASVLQMIILSLLLHPKAQDTAHQQIRHHLSSKRPVTLDDRPNLPYIDMIIRETLRWHPVLPLGLARCSVKEDVYKGYRIPKGTVVLPNVWAAAVREDVGGNGVKKYPLDKFVPERFMEGDLYYDPYEYSFGFGRRWCPGKHIAMNTLWLFTASIIQSFELLPTGGGCGGKMKMPAFRDAFVSPPEEFGCSFVPREGKGV